MESRQIIALGGGGFSMEPDNIRLDRYIVNQARRANPTVCFVPTASGDAEGYIARFYKAFETLPCPPNHLSLFRQPRDLERFVADCDVLYVGGGNTRNLLAIWRVPGFDAIVRRALNNGAVLAGLSAGAIFWFDAGLTDSAGGLDPIGGLGFLPGSCTPHYDGNAGRRPAFHALVQNGALSAGYALDDGVGLHFADEAIVGVVSSRPAGRAFHVEAVEGGIRETPLAVRMLD